MARNFVNKVILVTGSGSGIGEAVALTFSRLGASVVVTDRNGDHVKRVTNDCQSVSPNNLKPLDIMADLTVDADVRRLVNETASRFGRIDVLVNNAGVAGFTDICDDNVMEEYDRIMRINLRSAVYLTHLAVPYLEKSGGNIVNTASICAIKPIVNGFAYCMSKTALDMFTKCLAVDLGPKGIRVNSVDPGYIRTNLLVNMNMSAEQIIEWRRVNANATPLGVIGEPQDIANAVQFLASTDAAFITGTCMVCDGGLVCGSPAR